MGAPVGSVIVGSEKFITKAIRVRKALGGGMRQVGILAAAGLYGLTHNKNRMSIDHQNAKKVAKGLIFFLSFFRFTTNMRTLLIFGYLIFFSH